MADDLLSTKQAAELLGISHQRVRQYINDGRLPAKQLGRAYAIRRRDVERFEPNPVGYPKGRRRGRDDER